MYNMGTSTKQGKKSRVPSNTKIQYKGVYYVKISKRWRVVIRGDREQRCLGTYNTIDEAVAVYDRAALYYHGQFAVLNRPKDKQKYLDDPFIPNQATPRKANRYLGVCWHKTRMRWYAYISVEGKIKNLGVFMSDEEAARKRDEAALLYFGERAKLNFPI